MLNSQLEEWISNLTSINLHKKQSKLIEIVNVETGFIKFLEPSINKIHEDSVFCVYIEGADTL